MGGERTVANDLQSHPAAADEPGLLLPFRYPKSNSCLRWLQLLFLIIFELFGTVLLFC